VAEDDKPREPTALEKRRQEHAEGRRGALVGCSTLVGLVAVGGGLYLALARSELLRVPLSEEPALARIELPHPSTLRFSAMVDLENHSHAYEPTDRLPHLVDIVIEVAGAGPSSHELVCNPFDAHVFAWTSNRGATRRHYEGRLERCELALPSGAFELRASQRTRARDDRFRLRGLELVVQE
jgi:hypothetical protein